VNAQRRRSLSTVKVPASPTRSCGTSGLSSRLWGRESQRIEIDRCAALHVDEVGNPHLEAASDREEHVEGRVSPSPFDFGEVPERDTHPMSSVGLGPAETPASTLNAGRNLATERLGTHPKDETRPRFLNVTHYRSLRYVREVPMLARSVQISVVVLSMLFVACKDKAEPDYAACVQAEAKGDIEKAWNYCNDAVGADPTSTSGKAATAKLAELKPKYDEWKKQQDAYAAAAAEMDRKAQAAALAAGRAKVHRTRAETFDGSCTGQGKPGHSYRYEGATFDVNASVAQADGCSPQDEQVGWKGFVCCP